MTVDIAPDRVRSYPTSASFFNYHSLNRSVGLYQIVRGVTPGTRLRFSVWVNLLTTNSDVLPLSSAREPGGLRARLHPYHRQRLPHPKSQRPSGGL